MWIFNRGIKFNQEKNYTETRVKFHFQELAVFKEKQKLERSQGTGSSQGSQRFVGKKSVQYYKAAVEEFEGKFYLIGSEVFLLGGEGRKLTEDEVLNLPVIISWKGPDHEFIWDEKQCIELLCQILKDMNEMQNPKYKSFPLGKFMKVFHNLKICLPFGKKLE